MQLQLFQQYFPRNTPTIKSSRERICNHAEVEYKCGHRVYLVEAWYTRYQDTHIPYGPNPIERSVSIIIFVIRKHDVTELVFVERSSQTKNAVRSSIYLYQDAKHDRPDR